MQDLKNLLCDHLALHPQAQIRDAVKFIYQNEFGGGHLISDVPAGLCRLKAEMDSVKPDPSLPLAEPLGGGLARLNLASAKGILAPETIFSAFLAACAPRGSMESFLKKLELLYELGFPREDVEAYLQEYAASGCPQVSHSSQYRAAYSPAYRVVPDMFPWAWELFSAIDRQLCQGETVIAGIDGMCASGKTTLAALLAQVYDAALYHADDYFLPPEKRTAERLSQPGGNMDRERLEAEILLPISQGRGPVTRRFDCSRLTLEPPRSHPLKDVTIVEGSYCLHPQLRQYYSATALITCPPQTQLRRLEERDPDKLQAFIERWIPMENTYLSELDIASYAQVHLIS